MTTQISTSSKRKFTIVDEIDTKKLRTDNFHLFKSAWHPSPDVQQISRIMRSEAHNKILEKGPVEVEVTVYKIPIQEDKEDLSKFVQEQAYSSLEYDRKEIPTASKINSPGSPERGSLRQVLIDKLLARTFGQSTSRYDCTPEEIIKIPISSATLCMSKKISYGDIMKKFSRKTSVMQAYQNTFGSSHYENSLDKCRKTPTFASAATWYTSIFQCPSLYAPSVMASLENRYFDSFVDNLSFNIAQMLDLAVSRYSWYFQPKENVSSTIIAIVKGMYQIMLTAIYSKYYPKVIPYYKDFLVWKGKSVYAKLRATRFDGTSINSSTTENKITLSYLSFVDSKEDPILYRESSQPLRQTYQDYYRDVLLPYAKDSMSETTKSMYTEFMEADTFQTKERSSIEGDMQASRYAQRGFLSKEDKEMDAISAAFEDIAITKNKIIKEKYGYVCSCRKCVLKESSVVLNEELFAKSVLFNLSMDSYKRLLYNIDAFPARYDMSVELIKYSLEEVLDILSNKEMSCITTSILEKSIVQDTLLCEEDEELHNVSKDTTIEQLDEILRQLTTQHKVVYADTDSTFVEIKRPFDVVTEIPKALDSSDEIRWVEPVQDRSVINWKEYSKIGTGKTCAAINIAEQFRSSGLSVYLIPSKKTSRPIDNSIFDE